MSLLSTNSASTAARDRLGHPRVSSTSGAASAVLVVVGMVAWPMAVSAGVDICRAGAGGLGARAGQRSVWRGRGGGGGGGGGGGAGGGGRRSRHGGGGGGGGREEAVAVAAVVVAVVAAVSD